MGTAPDRNLRPPKAKMPGPSAMPSRRGVMCGPTHLSDRLESTYDPRTVMACTRLPTPTAMACCIDLRHPFSVLCRLSDVGSQSASPCLTGWLNQNALPDGNGSYRRPADLSAELLLPGQHPPSGTSPPKAAAPSRCLRGVCGQTFIKAWRTARPNKSLKLTIPLSRPLQSQGARQP